MNRVCGLGVAVSLIALGGGCAGAQVVRRDNRGGELAVWGPVVGATQQARRVLIEQCAGHFAVGRGADALGLGRVDADIPPVAIQESVPEGARVFAYRCSRDESNNSRAVALVQGGLGR